MKNYISHNYGVIYITQYSLYADILYNNTLLSLVALNDISMAIACNKKQIEMFKVKVLLKIEKVPYKMKQKEFFWGRLIRGMKK